MTPFEKLKERYRNDAAFHHMVKVIENALHLAVLTPSEVRDAAVFASIKFELMNPQPILYWEQEKK